MLFKIIHVKEIHIMNNKGAITLTQLKQFIKNAFKKLPEKYTLAYIDLEGDKITLSNEADVAILHQSGLNKVKIEIEETSEEFYDQTEEVFIGNLKDNFEPEIVEQKEQKIQIKLEDFKPDIIHLSQSQLSNIQNLDQSIEEKMRIMMPDMIKKIKEQLIEESKLSESKIFPIIEEKIKHLNYICDECKKNPIQGIRYKCAVCPNFDLCQNCEAKTSHDHPFLKIKKPSQAPYKIIAILNNDQSDSLQINGQKIKIPGLQQGLGFLSNFLKNNSQNNGNPNACPRSRKCPFGNEQKMKEWKEMKNQWKKKNQEMWEGMKRNKSQEKKQQQIKTEAKCQQPEIIQKKIQFQAKEKVIQKKQQPVVIQEKPVIERPKVSLTEEDMITEKTNYISEILDKNFGKCYKYVKNNKNLTKQELLQLYFIEMPF